jgi:hypothetical protein
MSSSSSRSPADSSEPAPGDVTYQLHQVIRSILRHNIQVYRAWGHPRITLDDGTVGCFGAQMAVCAVLYMHHSLGDAPIYWEFLRTEVTLAAQDFFRDLSSQDDAPRPAKSPGLNLFFAVPDPRIPESQWRIHTYSDVINWATTHSRWCFASCTQKSRKRPEYLASYGAYSQILASRVIAVSAQTYPVLVPPANPFHLIDSDHPFHPVSNNRTPGDVPESSVSTRAEPLSPEGTFAPPNNPRPFGNISIKGDSTDEEEFEEECDEDDVLTIAQGSPFLEIDVDTSPFEPRPVRAPPVPTPARAAASEPPARWQITPPSSSSGTATAPAVSPVPEAASPITDTFRATVLILSEKLVSELVAAHGKVAGDWKRRATDAEDRLAIMARESEALKRKVDVMTEELEKARESKKAALARLEYTTRMFQEDAQ